MDPRFAPFVIASHWPYVDRQLELTRQPARRRSLQLLAELQVDAGGDPVRLGRTRLRALGLSPGEADHVNDTLRDLAARKVVDRLAGRGSRAGAWSFRGDLEHWRAMPWRTSARSVSRVIFGCARSRVCEGPPAFVRESPDQSIRRSPEILLGSAAHLYRSGETLVGIPNKRGASRTNAEFRAWPPVDIPNKPTTEDPAPHISGSPSENSLYLDRQLEIIQGAFRAACGGEIFIGSKRWPDLVTLAASVSIDQAEAIAQDIQNANVRREHKLRAPLLLTRAQELARSPLIASLADAGPTDLSSRPASL